MEELPPADPIVRRFLARLAATSNTKVMVVYKAEYKQWRAMDAELRAKLLVQYADMCWLMLETQHTRTGLYWEQPDSYAIARMQVFQQRLDVDYFFVALNRLIQVGDVVQETADPRSVMPDARAKFERVTSGFVLDPLTDKPVTITSVRNALEHLNPDNVSIDFERSEHGWLVAYGETQFHTLTLYQAAFELWRAIRRALDAEPN